MRAGTVKHSFARVELRVSQYQKFCRLKGWNTIERQAREIGVDPATISRVVNGLTGPGERFIAGILVAFPELDFNDLFEVNADEEVAS